MGPNYQRNPRHGERDSRYRESAAIVRDTKDTQDAVTSILIKYLELSESMRAFEDTFSTQILSTASELFSARTRRKRLEAAYENIRVGINNGEYEDDDQLQKAVDDTLKLIDVDLDDLHRTPVLKPNGNDDDEFDPVSKERIYRAFRRIVLPRVYPDTSDADYSEFEAAFTAYETRDYTLMEAFVIRYWDDIGLEEDGNVLTTAQLKTRLKEYQAAQNRLENRLNVLRREVTTTELRAPEQARRRLEEQGQKFRQAILEEADRIRELQDSLRSLTIATHHGR